MLHGIHHAAAKNLALARLQEVIANNLANAETTGFKRQRVEFRDEFERVGSRLGRGVDPAETIVPETQIDWSNGPLRGTGAPFDLAIAGEGFFVVQTDRGEAYTRAGRFHLDDEGFLVNQDGHQVVGEGGPIQIEGLDVAVGRDGQVTVDDQPLDRLKLVAFDEPFPLEKIGRSLFRAKDGADPREPGPETVVRQGYLEGSNVEPVQEMVTMLIGFRAYEAGVKAIQAQDQTLERAVNDVGRTS
jgi:flagellar basal-body rod protein FlgG